MPSRQDNSSNSHNNDRRSLPLPISYRCILLSAIVFNCTAVAWWYRQNGDSLFLFEDIGSFGVGNDIPLPESLGLDVSTMFTPLLSTTLSAINGTTSGKRTDGGDGSDDDHHHSHSHHQQQHDESQDAFEVGLPNSALMDSEVVRDFDPYALPSEELSALRNMSSLDYRCCCGLGHRLSKMADAFYIAEWKNLGLRMNWGLCGTIDTANFLFTPQPPWELSDRMNPPQGERLLQTNNVWGFKKLTRFGPNSTEWGKSNNFSCSAKEDKYWSDVRYYQSLRDRFRFKNKVANFRKRVFTNHTVIGMHIRAGNNETGDFTDKNRGVANEDSWVANMAGHIRDLGQNAHPDYPPLLYMATDTPHLITKFREALNGVMSVRDLPQTRPDEGKGVFFGQGNAVRSEERTCLQGWISAMSDMMLLSYADVVLAARPSSFIQSMPMIMSYAKPKRTRVYSHPYCEFLANATQKRCYSTFMEWACEGRWDFALPPMIQRVEYLRVPYDVQTANYEARRMVRPSIPGSCRVTVGQPNPECLEYDNPTLALSPTLQEWLKEENT